MQRRKAGQPSTVASLDELAAFGAPQLGVYEPDSPLDEEIKREAMDHLEQAIWERPLAFRMPLILRDILEFPIRDIAHMTGPKEATVKTRLHRGRLKQESLDRGEKNRLLSSMPSFVNAVKWCLRAWT